jgi:hypothetical protein
VDLHTAAAVGGGARRSRLVGRRSPSIIVVGPVMG